MNNKYFDAVVIGGGASGLMCAVSAKMHNSKIKIAVIEKNDRVGKKLLSTGNGRCNLTNKNINSKHYCGSFAQKSNTVFAKYDTNRITEIFKVLGLMTFADSEGRYYPVCKQASAVLDVLRFACSRLQIEIFCSQNIRSIKKQGGGFAVVTDCGVLSCQKLVIACGSKASPKLGATASALDFLKNLGHKPAVFSPALCPVRVNSPLLKSLKGIRCVCRAALLDSNDSVIKSELGEVQFADSALSGICIFNLSLYSRKGHKIILDLLPNISKQELLPVMQKQIMLFGRLTVDCLFTGIFHKRLGIAVLKSAGIKDMSRTCSSLMPNELVRICTAAKNLSFEVSENSDFAQAQACRGGAPAGEIDENTMESKLVKNLFIVGEAVDICGECGGFNLHFAFASGHLAGENL